MNRIFASAAVTCALLAGGLAIAASGDPATPSSGEKGSGAIGPGAVRGTPANDSSAGIPSASVDEHELKACLARKKSGDHSMSQADREKACRAEAEENAVQPVASVRGR